jgi:acid phosphatase class B
MDSIFERSATDTIITMDILNRKTLQTASILALAFIMTSCASTGFQPLPPVKVITETVEVEIYSPPLPSAIQLNDVDWKVITNTPCKPATGKQNLSGGKWYYTTERFAYDQVLQEDGTTKRVVQRDENKKRIELEQLTDGNGVIEVCGNLQQKIAEVELMLDGDFVIFAMTPVGYEKMSANLQDIKRYINQQKDIIYYYREATAPKGIEGWLEENKERQDNQNEAIEAEKVEPTGPAPSVKETKSAFSITNLLPGLGNKDD